MRNDMIVMAMSRSRFDEILSQLLYSLDNEANEDHFAIHY